VTLLTPAISSRRSSPKRRTRRSCSRSTARIPPERPRAEASRQPPIAGGVSPVRTASGLAFALEYGRNLVDRGDSEDATRPDRLMSGTPRDASTRRPTPPVESACGSSDLRHDGRHPSSSEPARSGAGSPHRGARDRAASSNRCRWSGSTAWSSADGTLVRPHWWPGHAPWPSRSARASRPGRGARGRSPDGRRPRSARRGRGASSWLRRLEAACDDLDRFRREARRWRRSSW